MKKYIYVIAALILFFCLSGWSCYHLTDPVLASLPKYESREFYTSGGFQDFTDYAKYTYESVTAKRLSASRYFDEVTENDTKEILSYINNFEKFVHEDEGIKEYYDFDKSNVSVGDFFYLYTKDGEPFGNGICDSSDNYTEYTFDGEFEISYSGTYDKFDFYDLYYFDISEQILYYFHNDI